MKGGPKRNEILLLKKQKYFENFHRRLSVSSSSFENSGDDISGGSVCSMRLACEACLSHAMSPTFHG